MRDRTIVRPFGLFGHSYRVNEAGLIFMRLAWIVAWSCIPTLLVIPYVWPATQVWFGLIVIFAIQLPVTVVLCLLVVRNGKRLQSKC